MNIPLLNREEVEKVGEEVEKVGEDIGMSIRDEVIEFLKSKGYRYVPAEEEFGDESDDFFTKGEQLIQVTINNEIPDEILEQMAREDNEAKESS